MCKKKTMSSEAGAGAGTGAGAAPKQASSETLNLLVI